MLDEKCHGCNESGQHFVFHIEWDMGSSRVKSAEETPLKLDSKNLDAHFLGADRVATGFGMLHILKAIINKTHNFSLCFHGQNYGIHILRSMKNEDDIAAEYHSKMKNAVLVGKDRHTYIH